MRKHRIAALLRADTTHSLTLRDGVFIHRKTGSTIAVDDALFTVNGERHFIMPDNALKAAGRPPIHPEPAPGTKRS